MRKYKANGGYRISMSEDEYKELRNSGDGLYLAIGTMVVGVIVGFLIGLGV